MTIEPMAWSTPDARKWSEWSGSDGPTGDASSSSLAFPWQSADSSREDSGDGGGENTQMAEPARATSLAKRRTWDAGQAWSRWGRSWDAGQAWSRWWQSWDAGQAWSRWPTVDRQQRAANWWSSNSEVSRGAGQSNAGSGHWWPPPPPPLKDLPPQPPPPAHCRWHGPGNDSPVHIAQKHILASKTITVEDAVKGILG